MTEPTSNQPIDHPTIRLIDHPTIPADHRPVDGRVVESTRVVDHELEAAVRRSSKLRGGFYLVVLLVALAGQVTGATERLGLSWYVALPAVAALELGGMVVMSNADVRRRLGERAYASMALSFGIAAFATTFNLVCHKDHLLGIFFGGMSTLGYLVYLMASANARRDRLRRDGNLPATPPVYGLRWVQHPGMTRRARSLARADKDLGLYGSLAAAKTEVDAERLAKLALRRQRAISKVLRRKIAKSADKVTAEIAVTVFRLDEVAARLAAGANYDGLTALIAADLDPARLLADRPVASTTPVDSTTLLAAIDQVAVGHPTTQVSTTDRPTTERVSIDHPTIDHPTTLVDPTTRPMVDRLAIDQATSSRPTTDQSTTDQLAGRSTDHPMVDRPVDDTPVDSNLPTIIIRPDEADRATRRARFRVVGEPAATANARILREKYGSDLPASEQQVRKGMVWSQERAKNAIAAYRAGADLPQQAPREQATEPSTPTSEDRADEDGQPAAATA